MHISYSQLVRIATLASLAFASLLTAAPHSRERTYQSADVSQASQRLRTRNIRADEARASLILKLKPLQQSYFQAIRHTSDMSFPEDFDGPAEDWMAEFRSRADALFDSRLAYANIIWGLRNGKYDGEDIPEADRSSYEQLRSLSDHIALVADGYGQTIEKTKVSRDEATRIRMFEEDAVKFRYLARMELLRTASADYDSWPNDVELYRKAYVSPALIEDMFKGSGDQKARDMHTREHQLLRRLSEDEVPRLRLPSKAPALLEDKRSSSTPTESDEDAALRTQRYKEDFAEVSRIAFTLFGGQKKHFIPETVRLWQTTKDDLVEQTVWWRRIVSAREAWPPQTPEEAVELALGELALVKARYRVRRFCEDDTASDIRESSAGMIDIADILPPLPRIKPV